MSESATMCAGNSGPAVRAFRKALAANGRLGKAAPDNDVYDQWMVQAVKNFQIKHKLIPTGVAAPELQALMQQKQPIITPALRKRLLSDGVMEHLTAHMRNVQYPQEALLYVPQPVSQLRPGSQGMLFLGQLEGSINHFYVPSEGSGITAGVGYDMKERNADSVKQDLTKAEVWNELSTPVQKLWTTGADLDGDYALWKLFAEENDGVEVLTAPQSWKLFSYAVETQYLPMLKKVLPKHLLLLQPQFDALLSFMYNVGHLPHAAVQALSEKTPDFEGAARSMSSVVTSSGIVNKNLVERREKEIRLFLYGHYGQPTFRHGPLQGTSKKKLLKQIPTELRREFPGQRSA